MYESKAFPHEMKRNVIGNGCEALQVHSMKVDVVLNSDKDSHSRNRIFIPTYFFRLLCGKEKLLALVRFEILRNKQKISAAQEEEGWGKYFHNNKLLTCSAQQWFMPKVFFAIWKTNQGRSNMKEVYPKKISTSSTTMSTVRHLASMEEKFFYVSSNL